MREECAKPRRAWPGVRFLIRKREQRKYLACFQSHVGSNLQLAFKIVFKFHVILLKLQRRYIVKNKQHTPPL